MEKQLEEAKSEMEETFSAAIRKVKQECIVLDGQSSMELREEINGKFDVTEKSWQKAMNAAIAQNTSAMEEQFEALQQAIVNKHEWSKAALKKNLETMEDLARMKVCEEETERIAVVESITKKVDATSKRFLDLFADMTDKQLEFTQERRIEALQDKHQMHSRLQACETRSPPRIEGQHTGQTHESKFSRRNPLRAPRPDSDEAGATERRQEGSRDDHETEMLLLESSGSTAPRPYSDGAGAIGRRQDGSRGGHETGMLGLENSKVYRSDEALKYPQGMQLTGKQSASGQAATRGFSVRAYNQEVINTRLTQQSLMDAGMEDFMHDDRGQSVAGNKAQREASLDPDRDFD